MVLLPGGNLQPVSLLPEPEIGDNPRMAACHYRMWDLASGIHGTSFITINMASGGIRR